jgi:putative aldouronate transport system permease protein
MALPRARGRQRISSSLFQVVNCAFLAVVGFLTGFPFLHLLVGSLTEPSRYRLSGVSYNPLHWTLDWYRFLLSGRSPVYQALKVSVFVTVVGTLLSVTTTAALAYGLSKREVPGNRVLIWLILLTMMFDGGMVPLYLVVRGLKLTNTVWSVIIPRMINAFYLFVMVKALESLPPDLEDAARLDGCSEVSVFVRIVLPMCKPIIVTIGLFYAVDHWNEWFLPLIFLRDTRLYPLQLVLRGLVGDSRGGGMAAMVLSSLPIIALAVLMQKHFVRGLVLPLQGKGSVYD